jgi:hypothetical protein
MSDKTSITARGVKGNIVDLKMVEGQAVEAVEVGLNLTLDTMIKFRLDDLGGSGPAMNDLALLHHEFAVFEQQVG